MPVIGISGSYGGLNMGDEAILSATLPQFRAALPDAEIVVFSRNPEHTARHHDVDRVLNPRDTLREEIEPEVRRLDLLLLGGGGILYDAEARMYLREVTIAHQYGVPTFAFAIGVGPLNSAEERHAVREALERMAGISVRDTSAKRLLEDIGLSTPVTVTSDPAFLLTPEPFPAEELLYQGIRTDGRLVGLSLRERGDAAPSLEHAEYHGLLADTADFIVRRYDCDILFVPMEMADIREAHRVIGLMMQPERAHVLRFGYAPRQVLGLMQHFRMAVGMRLHFLIFAAICGVPLVALPYASKVADLILALGLPRRAAAPEEKTGLFLADLDRAWDDEQEIWRNLPQRVDALKEQSSRTVPMALKAMRSRAPGPETSGPGGA